MVVFNCDVVCSKGGVRVVDIKFSHIKDLKMDINETAGPYFSRFNPWAHRERRFSQTLELFPRTLGGLRPHFEHHWFLSHHV